MAQRRSRRSSGLLPLEASPEEQLAQFDDFRKRHHRQNKEIIQENINRRKLIRGLQDQVGALQAEVLELRRTNAALSRRVAASGRGAVWDDASRQALEMVLAAVPALERLRGALDAAPRASGLDMAAWSDVAGGGLGLGNPTATRPAATAQQSLTLGTLAEGPEESTPRRRSRGRRSSTSASTTSASEYLPSAPGSPFASPSPKRTNTTPRRRRRRESGLFSSNASAAMNSASSDTRHSRGYDGHKESFGPPLINRRPADTAHAAADAFADADESAPEPEPELARAGAWAEHADVQEEDCVEAVVTPTGRGARARRSFPSVSVKDVAKQLDAAAAAAAEEVRLEGRRTPTPDRSPAAVGGTWRSSPPLSSSSPAAASPSTTLSVSSPLSPLPEDARPRSTSPTPAPVTAHLSQSASTPALETDAPRARRARASVVTYKEPSLRKKMRKPDGIPAEEALGLRPRHAGATTLDTAAVGVRRKSALPRSTAKPDLGVGMSDTDGEVSDSAGAEGAGVAGVAGPRRPPTPIVDENAPPALSARYPLDAKTSGHPHASHHAHSATPLHELAHNTPATAPASASSRKRPAGSSTQKRRPVPPL